MGKRIISAAVALPIVLVLIHLGGWYFVGLAGFAALVCLVEAARMTQGGDRIAEGVMIALGLALFSGAVTGVLFGPNGFLLFALGFLLLLLFHLFRTGDLGTVASRLGLAFLTSFWIGGLLGILALLRGLEGGATWLYLAFAIAFGSDTGGYFAGRFLGKRKLYEKVSPKKTWAGAVGGVVFSGALAVVVVELVGGIELSTLALLGFLAIPGAALGQMGDLAESLLKRSVGVKDSGSIMPGHGGLFDRIDALLLVGVWLFGFARLVLDSPVTWLVRFP
ncbi:MAG: phosphatidate cytidylyltransferase [Deltaproteobacteria bacterium]|nr:phosphatidate cytidylyltransferase [Deltaproteobacteria bacterium]